MRYTSPLQTPGVYIKEIDAFPPSVAQVATAIPAFIGYTQNHPTTTPTRITSMLEYEQKFGAAPPAAIVKVVLDANNQPTADTVFKASNYCLYNSLQLFYSNGGGVCYIVSVGTYSDEIAGETLKKGLDLLASFDEPTLILFPDAIHVADATDLGNLQKDALMQCATLQDRFCIMDVMQTGDIDTDCNVFRDQVGNQDLKYGAAYYPYLNARFMNAIRFTDIHGEAAGKVNFKTLYPGDEIGEAIDALLEMEVETLEDLAVYQLAEAELVKNMPVYSVILNKLSQSVNTLPPSAAIAGVYANTDATRGVWKAPANVSLNGIVGLAVTINDAKQANMNVSDTGKSINAIRSFFGKGELVWGARTLDGNSDDWCYINVRRLANMIEESVMKACMRFTFEPNVALTWVNVKGMIENFLTSLWNEGALAGAKPEHAFFVQIGLNQTMTAQDILDGKMIVKIGYAPSRPAEFIVLEFKQMMQKS